MARATGRYKRGNERLRRSMREAAAELRRRRCLCNDAVAGAVRAALAC